MGRASVHEVGRPGGGERNVQDKSATRLDEVHRRLIRWTRFRFKKVEHRAFVLSAAIDSMNFHFHFG